MAGTAKHLDIVGAVVPDLPVLVMPAKPVSRTATAAFHQVRKERPGPPVTVTETTRLSRGLMRIRPVQLVAGVAAPDGQIGKSPRFTKVFPDPSVLTRNNLS